MAKKLNLVLIFAGVLLLDGLVLPGLFNFRQGTLTMAFLLAMLLNWGPVAPVLWLGSGISLFLEFFWQIPIGSMLFMFLLASLVYFFVASAFSVKRYAGAAVLSFGAFPAFWHNGFVAVITAFAGFLLCFFLFDKICSEKKNIKFL